MQDVVKLDSIDPSAERKKDESGRQKHPSFNEAARRAQIIACTIETLATLGYAQVSLAQIAKRAGISKGVITYYFSSKEELFEQVIIEIFTDAASFIGPQLAAQPTAALMFQTYIQTHVEYISTHLMQMMAIMELVDKLLKRSDLIAASVLQLKHNTLQKDQDLCAILRISRWVSVSNWGV